MWPADVFRKASTFLNLFETLENQEITNLKSRYLVSLRNLEDLLPLGQQPRLAPIGQN